LREFIHSLTEKRENQPPLKKYPKSLKPYLLLRKIPTIGNKKKMKWWIS